MKGQGDDYDLDTQSEVSAASSQRRGRPIAKFDDGIPNPEV